MPVGDVDRREKHRPKVGTRRLVQDFVTAPRPLVDVLDRVATEPSSLQAMIERAALRSYAMPADDVESAPVAVVEVRNLHDGWSAHLEWEGSLGGLPPFDGELTILGADPHRTWIGLEGTVHLSPQASWSDAPLLLARLEVRDLLLHLADAVSAEGTGE